MVNIPGLISEADFVRLPADKKREILSLVEEMARRERLKRLDDRKEACEEDLLEFIRLFWPIIEPQTVLSISWTLEFLCDYLMAVSDGHIKRGIMNIFPGAMKSLTFNVFWPAWEWGPRNCPHFRYICASRDFYLTERDNARFLRIVQSDEYQYLWGDHVAIEREGVQQISNYQTGWKLATSTKGKTGARGDRIIIDDPNSTDPNMIESEAVNRQTEGWLREVMPDRLNNLEEGVILLIQQRTGERDATAILAEHGTDYVWASVPMEFDPLRIFPVVLKRDDDGNPIDTWIDPRALDADGNMLEGISYDRDNKPQLMAGSAMARAEGILAWPERFPVEQVEEQKRMKGAWAFASQYQQMPSVRGGEIIRQEWWKLWGRANYPEVGTVIAALDTSIEQGEMNDFNAMTVWGCFPSAEGGEPQFILMWAWRDKLPLAQLVARVNEIAVKWKVDYLLIEHKTRGRDVHDELKRLYQYASFQTILWPPKGQPFGDKMSRLKSVSHFFSGDVRKVPVPGKAGESMDLWTGGCIYAPNTDWADQVISEVSAFPRGGHDDYVDTVSMALNFARVQGVILRKPEYQAREDEAKRFKPKQGVPYAIK